MKLILKIAGVIVLAIIVVAVAVFSIYWYRNIHWYDKYEKALKKVNAGKHIISDIATGDS